MPVFTFHCLTKDDTATSFVFHEFEDEAAARRHTDTLFRDWTTCARIEVDRNGCEPFIVSRSEHQASSGDHRPPSATVRGARPASPRA